MNIVLFGFKGVGKTYYGKKVAEKLGWQFVDIDDLIQEEYEKDNGEKLEIPEIFEKVGNVPFRDIEQKVTCKLNPESDTIISVGGGTVLNPPNIDHLQTVAHFIYLIDKKEAVKQRMLDERIPSYLDANNFDASFDKMYGMRNPIYKKLAEASLDLPSCSSEEEIVEKLIELIDSFRKKD